MKLFMKTANTEKTVGTNYEFTVLLSLTSGVVQQVARYNSKEKSRLEIQIWESSAIAGNLGPGGS